MLPLRMPLSAVTAERRGRFDNSSPFTRSLTRGVCRMLTEEGYGPITEFRLPNRRRVDVIGLGGGSEFLIVEVKSSVADFRGDAKWREYLPYCDRFYFAVPENFPTGILPDDCGLMVADSYGAAIRREAPERPIGTLRRRRQLLRFALTASDQAAPDVRPPSMKTRRTKALPGARHRVKFTPRGWQRVERGDRPSDEDPRCYELLSSHGWPWPQAPAPPRKPPRNPPSLRPSSRSKGPPAC